MKIDINNSDYLDGTYHLSLKTERSSKEISAKDLVQELDDKTYSLYDIQDMNVIINNNDCSDSFFQDICEQLREDGLVFQTNAGHINQDVDNATIITLDMQYNAGASTLLFAPYNNTRIGYSDSLVLAMDASFRHNYPINTEILTGKVGFRKNEDGSIMHLVPTETEEDLDENANVSFVTISLGTNHSDAKTVAKSIEGGLIRQKNYLEHFDTGSDLIYRADAGEEVSVVANYFGSSVNSLCQVNHIKDLDVLETRTIINPDVVQINAFDATRDYSYNDEKNKTL